LRFSPEADEAKLFRKLCSTINLKSKIMKSTCLIIVFLIISGTIAAQGAPPEAINFQAVVRDATGNPVANQNVGFKSSILKNSISGIIVYSESHLKTTNQFGLAILEIGSGTVISGDFSEIDWSSDAYYLKTEMDITGGTNYIFMGTSQFATVPYSFYAAHADTAQYAFTGTQGPPGPANTLDMAYDQGGAGAGRIINADNGSVEINTASSTALIGKSLSLINTDAGIRAIGNGIFLPGIPQAAALEIHDGAIRVTGDDDNVPKPAGIIEILTDSWGDFLMTDEITCDNCSHMHSIGSIADCTLDNGLIVPGSVILLTVETNFAYPVFVNIVSIEAGTAHVRFTTFGCYGVEPDACSHPASVKAHYLIINP
jgi:hypothetical protein